MITDQFAKQRIAFTLLSDMDTWEGVGGFKYRIAFSRRFVMYGQMAGVPLQDTAVSKYRSLLFEYRYRRTEVRGTFVLPITSFAARCCVDGLHNLTV